MADFKQFAVEVSELAVATREELQTIESEYAAAAEEKKKFPPKVGESAAYLAQSAEAEARFIKADKAHQDAKRRIPQEVERKLSSIRAGLAEVVEREFSAKPADIDEKTIALLRTGVLTPREYKTLLNDATETRNYTMTRVISDAAWKEAGTLPTEDPMARELREVTSIAKRYTGGAYLQNLDVLADVMRRGLKNPYMLKNWERLTEEIISNGFR